MRSQFEKKVATYLHSKGVVYEYEAYEFDYEEPLRKNRSRCGDCNSRNLVRLGTYTPDFYLPEGKLFIETKGRWTAADRRKMLAVIKLHPEERFVMQFMRDNRIHKRSTTHYSDWCMENGIEYCIGVESLKEWIT
jgi:hypothetical protein